MSLPREFQFSQTSLQDLADCRRRFCLRHVQRRPWPALPAERAHAEQLEAGARFHQAVQQFLVGVPAEAIAAGLPAAPLGAWWRRFQAAAPALWGGGPRPAAGRYRAEFELTAPLGGHRLLAKYDLVLVRPDGGVTILDWKTAGQRPSRARLAGWLQSRVYPLVMALAGGELTGGPAPAPEQIELIYWFADAAAESERFAYSARQLAQDQAELAALIAAAEQLDPAEDLRTAHIERCRWCVYASLCDRVQSAAGQPAEVRADPPEDAPAWPETEEPG